MDVCVTPTPQYQELCFTKFLLSNLTYKLCTPFYVQLSTWFGGDLYDKLISKRKFHFDNEQDHVHPSSEYYVANGYERDLDLQIISY